MLKEIIVEAIVLIAMAAIAHFIGLRKAKLIDRPIHEDFIIEPPVRKRTRTKHAIAMREQFARRNRHACVETESLIVLPSISFNWTIGSIAGIIMMVMLCTNHADGVAEFGRAADHSIFYDYMIAIGIFFTISLAIAGWIAEKAIPDAAKAQAHEIANNRIRKGRTVRFVQDFSIDELPARARWAYEEVKAERKAAKAKAKIVRKDFTSSKKVISILPQVAQR